MKYYQCKACGSRFDKKIMNCPNCGSEDIGLFIKRIVLNFPGVRHPFSVHKPMRIGRNHLRLYGDLYRVLAEEQFECFIKDGKWMIKDLKGRNPTLLNGKDISNKPSVLNEGDKIKIANFELTIGFVETEILSD